MSGTYSPEKLGQYEIGEPIAEGRLVVAYRARSLRSGVPVCVKLLRPEAANDPAVRGRFVHSARSLLGVQLPNVTTIRDLGEHEGRPYIVTDLVAGKDLGLIIGRAGPLRIPAAVRYLAQTATGLDAVASLGHLHGDIRPGHLLMQRGTIYVVGFGRGQLWTTAQGRRVWGDPAYLPPEILTGRPPDVRSDIYALGCTYYELVTGRPPFGAGPPDAVLACHAHEPFPSARQINALIPDAFDDLLRSMASKNANQRPQDYAEFMQELERIGPAIAAGAQLPPKLVVVSGRAVGKEVLITEGEFLLGRTPGEGFEIDDGRISRRHALLHRDGTRVEVEDLGSRNGIKVNGTQASRVALKNGDEIGIGDTVVRIENIESDDDTIPPDIAESPNVKAAPSSPLRGAFGASEISHTPQHQVRVASLDADGVVPTHLRALAHLAVSLAKDVTDRRALLFDTLNTTRDIINADKVLLVPVGAQGPVLKAETAEQAQTLSCILPAVERALPGKLSLLTSVRVGRDGAWAVALAPVMAGDAAEAYFVLVKQHGTFDPDTLATLELLADVVSIQRGDAAEPLTQEMSAIVRP